MLCQFVPFDVTHQQGEMQDLKTEMLSGIMGVFSGGEGPPCQLGPLGDHE